LTQARKRKAIS